MLKYNVVTVDVLQGGVETEQFCRKVINVNRNETLFFKPQGLSAEEAAATLIKRAQFGACFKGKLQSLPMDTCQIVWEAALMDDGTPYVRPLKPKFYLLSTVTFQAGKYYKLV